MTPESPLFSAYQEPLELAAAAVEFTERMNAAFGNVHMRLSGLQPESDLPSPCRDVEDADKVRAAIATGSLPDRDNLELSFSPSNTTSGRKKPVGAGLTAAYEKANHQGQDIESRFACIEGDQKAPYAVLRLVASSPGCPVLPDSRGFYAARSRTTRRFIFFKVETEQPQLDSRARYVGATAATKEIRRPAPLEEASSGGQVHLPAYRVKELEAAERLALLEEFEKAARMPRRQR